MCTEYFASLGPCVSRNPRNYSTKAHNARENTLCIEYFAPRVSKSRESLCNLHVLAKPRCAPSMSLSWARAFPETLGITSQKRITLAKTRCASSISHRGFQNPRNHCVNCTCSQNLGVHRVFRSSGPVRLPKPWELLHKSA